MKAESTTLPTPWRKHSFYIRWVEEWWLGELAAVAGSCLLTLALAIIVWRFDGQPVPDLGSVLESGITLGTVVALLATLIAAMALVAIQECLGQLKWIWFYSGNRPLSDAETYDRASRGPLGSLALLWRLRIRGSVLASLGAFLMVAQLLIVPLTQQSIVYVSESIPDLSPSALAQVPIAQSWSDDPDVPAVDTPVVTGGPSSYTSVTAVTKGAIMNGFYSGQLAINDSAPACSTGNCTFPMYTSLGVCAYAANVTSHLNVTGSYEAMTQVACLPHNFCLYQLSPDTGNAVLNVTTSTEPGRNLLVDAAFVNSPVSLNFTSLAFSNHSNPLTDAYVIYDNHDEGYNAVEFVIDWCVPTFSTHVVNGFATTTRVSSPPLSLAPLPAGQFDMFRYPDGAMGGTVGSTTYIIETSAHATLQRYFQRLINGTALFSESYLVDNDQIEAIGNALNYFSVTDTDGSNPSPTTDLSSFDLLLNNIATSMTNRIRTYANNANLNPSIPNPLINGTAFVQRNIVKVYWGWIVPSILLSVLTLIFVVLVALLRPKRLTRSADQTPIQRPLIWKTSQIAALRALDPDLQNDLGGLTQGGEMKIDAKAAQVRLIQIDGEWRLASVAQEF